MRYQLRVVEHLRIIDTFHIEKNIFKLNLLQQKDSYLYVSDSVTFVSGSDKLRFVEEK